MSDASSAVTSTSVYTDSKPWRYYREDSVEKEPSIVIVYGYDGLPILLVAPLSPDYVPGPEHPPSPDYVSGPEHPTSHVEVPYVPEPEYPEYLAPSDDEAPLADYPADGGDGDDEPSDDDDTNDEDSEEEPFEDEEDDKEEEEDAEALEADEPTHAPESPIIIPLSQTRLHRAQKTVRPEPPMSASMEACLARHATLPSPPLLVPSLPLPFPSPLTTSPTDTGATLGYKAAGIRMRDLLPSTPHRTDILEADMPPRKRAYLTTPALGFEIEESFAAGAARQPGPTKSDLRRYMVEHAGYGITDTWDEIVNTLMEIAPTTLEGVNERVTELDTTVKQRTDEFDIHFEEAQDDRALLRARVNTLFRDRPDHRHTAILMDSKAMYVPLGRIEILEARDPKPQEGPAEAGSSCVAAALAKYDVDRSKNGDTSNDTGTGRRRQMTTSRKCTYTNFLKCRHMSFQGTKGVIGLTQWIEKMESVFQISNCTIACQVKFASCTLQGSALTWWNSHMRAVGQDVACAMPWAALKRMITIMSDASSAVTSTSVYTDYEPWRYYREDSVKKGPSRVIVYGYDGLPILSVAPLSPDYVPGPEHPPSPDYVSSPEHPPLHVEEDPEDDQADYPADGGDGDDEPSDDDTDDEDSEDDEEEEEEHLAPANSSTVLIVDHVLPSGDAEALEADEPTHAPGSPIIIPISQTRLRRAQKTVRPEPPMSASMEACLARHAALPSPPLLAAGIRMRDLLPSTPHRTDILEADMPPWKRACLTTPALRFKIEESFTAGLARQPGPTKSDLRRYMVEQAGYGITDTWDEIVNTLMEIALTTLEGVNERVTELDTTVKQRTYEFDIRFEEAHDDRALLRARVNTLFRDRPDHRRTTILMDRDAMYVREA
nr:hypothetical protein [Tanacetum cinerariifolium]